MVSRTFAWRTGAYRDPGERPPPAAPAVPGRFGRIETAVRDQPVRTPMASRKCHACCAWTTEACRNRGERPSPGASPMVSRKCHA
eukprot:1295004-Pyramimonas_sp.AAC.1